MRQTFRKDERLHKKSLIKNLFENGDSFFIYPFRVTRIKEAFDSPYPVQLLISVPKSLHSRAVRRNLLKRRIREAYRKNKEELYTNLTERHEKLIVCITYSSKEILPFSLIQDKIILLLQRLKDGNG
jgi:ribonuclease P protein component